MKNLLGEFIPTTPEEILENAPYAPCSPDAVLLAFSTGNDSRTLAHVVKPWFDKSPYNLELAAIDTELGMDRWKASVREFANWIGLPVSFWKGEGREFYTDLVENRGFPGNATHSEVQNHLKGRAFRKMAYARRTDTEAPMKAAGVSVWILSGVRKFESRKRRLLKSPYSYREGTQFINPLFYWTNSQVHDYMDEHNIPLAPGKQWDCRCGCTAEDPAAEWREMEQKSPRLCGYLMSLHNPEPWPWASFDKSTHAARKQQEAGQASFVDDGSIESYPVCIDCWRDKAAENERLMREW